MVPRAAAVRDGVGHQLLQHQVELEGDLVRQRRLGGKPVDERGERRELGQVGSQGDFRHGHRRRRILADSRNHQNREFDSGAPG